MIFNDARAYFEHDRISRSPGHRNLVSSSCHLLHPLRPHRSDMPASDFVTPSTTARLHLTFDLQPPLFSKTISGNNTKMPHFNAISRLHCLAKIASESAYTPTAHFSILLSSYSIQSSHDTFANTTSSRKLIDIASTIDCADSLRTSEIGFAIERKIRSEISSESLFHDPKYPNTKDTLSTHPPATQQG
jgi:hypothetical protein